MQPVLSHTKVVGDPEPHHWLYLAHGIFGSGRNWGSVARRLVRARPAWGVVLLDLRLHGGSIGFAPPHTVQACADDVVNLADSLGLPPAAILGHSFGGKVALVAAGREPRRLRQVWVADSTLRTGPPGGDAWRLIEIVQSLPESFESRDALAAALEGHGYERAVGLWLGMNLIRTGAGLRWKLDWPGIETMLRDYFSEDVWPHIESAPGEIDVHVVKASRSDAIDPETERRLRAAGERTGRVHLHEVQGGHWLNIDSPDAVLDLLVQNLPS
jgi:esterase